MAPAARLLRPPTPLEEEYEYPERRIRLPPAREDPQRRRTGCRDWIHARLLGRDGSRVQAPAKMAAVDALGAKKTAAKSSRSGARGIPARPTVTLPCLSAGQSDHFGQSRVVFETLYPQPSCVQAAFFPASTISLLPATRSSSIFARVRTCASMLSKMPMVNANSAGVV